MLDPIDSDSGSRLNSSNKQKDFHLIKSQTDKNLWNQFTWHAKSSHLRSTSSFPITRELNCLIAANKRKVEHLYALSSQAAALSNKEKSLKPEFLSKNDLNYEFLIGQVGEEAATLEYMRDNEKRKIVIIKRKLETIGSLIEQYERKRDQAVESTRFVTRKNVSLTNKHRGIERRIRSQSKKHSVNMKTRQTLHQGQLTAIHNSIETISRINMKIHSNKARTMRLVNSLQDKDFEQKTLKIDQKTIKSTVSNFSDLLAQLNVFLQNNGQEPQLLYSICPEVLISLFTQFEITQSSLSRQHQELTDTLTKKYNLYRTLCGSLLTPAPNTGAAGVPSISAPNRHSSDLEQQSIRVYLQALTLSMNHLSILKSVVQRLSEPDKLFPQLKDTDSALVVLHKGFSPKRVDSLSDSFAYSSLRASEICALFNSQFPDKALASKFSALIKDHRTVDYFVNSETLSEYLASEHDPFTAFPRLVQSSHRTFRNNVEQLTAHSCILIQTTLKHTVDVKVQAANPNKDVKPVHRIPSTQRKQIRSMPVATSRRRFEIIIPSSPVKSVGKTSAQGPFNIFSSKFIVNELKCADRKLSQLRTYEHLI